MTEPIATFSFDDKFRRAREDMEASAKILENYRERKEDVLADLARSRLREMRRDRKITMRYLKHSDARLRIAALLLLKDYWLLPTDESAERCHRIAFEDYEAHVRGVALNALYYFIDKIHDIETHRLLMSLVHGHTNGDLALFTKKIQKLAWTREKHLRVGSDSINWQDERWKELPGTLLEMMKQNQQSTEQCIAHPDANVRLAALALLQSHWKAGTVLAQVCEKMIFEDPDPVVRDMALAKLASCYQNTDDPRIGELLATIVHDQCKAVEFRTQAYCDLFRVRGLPPQMWPFMAVGRGEFKFPEDVDWPFVDSFLAENEEEDQEKGQWHEWH